MNTNFKLAADLEAECMAWDARAAAKAANAERFQVDAIRAFEADAADLESTQVRTAAEQRIPDRNTFRIEHLRRGARELAIDLVS